MIYCNIYIFKYKRDIQGQLPKVLLHMISVPDGEMGGRLRIALVLGLVLIAGTAIEQAPSVGPLTDVVLYDNISNTRSKRLFSY